MHCSYIKPSHDVCDLGASLQGKIDIRTEGIRSPVNMSLYNMLWDARLEGEQNATAMKAVKRVVTWARPMIEMRYFREVLKMVKVMMARGGRKAEQWC